MKNKWVIGMLAVAGLITAVSAAYGVVYGINKYYRNKEKRKISKRLSLKIVEYLRTKNVLKKEEILKFVATEQQLMNHFKERTLNELRKMEKLSIVDLLNKYF